MRQRMESAPPIDPDPDSIRLRRLREDARRPLGVNLAEGIALSHMLMRFVGAARRR